ncbi:DNA-binding MarR family transcriptional regulator [Crossiella equi]|uniref:DNA-binding MarR family transcriptional regulator n=1 Tax=Crossiella equi TaxID=130796 RepID=A0ABS5AQH1_9PSEU|nr:MarR family transcriptional regulator [Crossiella equi]MBP2478819.1 DNA-binding MarR family transcriptional regulator [Crossiella equi]
MPALGKRDFELRSDHIQVTDELLAVMPRLRQAVHRNTRRHFPHAPLPEAQANLLRTVARLPGTTVREAAEQLQLAANTVSTLVATLGQAGLLERRTCPSDRRNARLYPTELALGRLAEFDGHRSRVLAEAMARLTSRQLASLHEAMPVLRQLLLELDAENSGHAD